MTSLKLLLEEDSNKISKKFSMLNEDLGVEEKNLEDAQTDEEKSRNTSRTFGSDKSELNDDIISKAQIEIAKKCAPIAISSLKKNTVWGSTVITEFINDTKTFKKILGSAVKIYTDATNDSVIKNNPKEFEKQIGKAVSSAGITSYFGIGDKRFAKLVSNDLQRSKNLIYNILNEVYSIKDIAIYNKEYLIEKNKDISLGLKFLLEEEGEDQQIQDSSKEEIEAKFIEKGTKVCALITLILSNFYLLKQTISELNNLVVENNKLVKKYLIGEESPNINKMAQNSIKGFALIKGGAPLASFVFGVSNPIGLAAVFAFPLFLKGVDSLFNLAKAKAVDIAGNIKAKPITTAIGLFIYQNVGKTIISIKENDNKRDKKSLINESPSKNNDILKDVIDFMQSKNMMHYGHMDKEKFRDIEINFAKKLSSFINIRFGAKTNVSANVDSNSDVSKEKLKATLSIVTNTAESSKITKNDSNKYEVDEGDVPTLPDICKLIIDSTNDKKLIVTKFMETLGNMHKFTSWEAFKRLNNDFDNFVFSS
jgi:hypothetical protein